MFWYYTLVWIILGFAAILLLIIPKTRSGILAKFGFFNYPETTASIWFHAVSVGELNSVAKLIQQFKTSYPNQPLIISTTTKTANAIACEQFSKMATVVYFPFDLPFAINKFLKTFQPIAVIIAETEIWPGFIHEARQQNIKLILVNGRMSPNSFKNYYRLRYFFKPVLQKFNLLCLQSAEEKYRYELVGGSNLPIAVTGNLKYDGINQVNEAEINSLKQKLLIKQNDFVLIAGSTHEGEESTIIEVFNQLVSQLPNLSHNLKLIIVPRHDERFNQVETLLISHNCHYVRFTNIEKISDNTNIILIDQMGILNKLYALAQLAFVGGTLVKVGGHNLLEPYNFKVPVVCGKYIYKTKLIANELLTLKAIKIVNDKQEFYQTVQELILNPQILAKMGQSGQKILTSAIGANDKTFALIDEIIFHKEGCLK